MNNFESVARFLIGACVACCLALNVAAQEVTNETEQESGVNEMLEDTGTIVSPVDLVPEIEAQVGMISPSLLSERFSKLQKTVPLLYHEESHKYVEYFVYKKREFTQRMLETKNVYFPIYEKILAQHGLPDELKYLSLIESGLNPRIISRAGAGGLWQFMRATGREFGLRQDRFIDERFDPEKSTEAACRYLKQLYSIFGDWEMALASYNCGPGNVRRAMRRTGENTFWGIYYSLPRETRNYVPQYVAMVYLMKYAEDHGITVQEPKFATAYDTLQINGYLNLNTFASLSGITMDEIQNLNPQLISSSLPAYTRGFVLKVPAAKYAMLSENLMAIRDSASRAVGNEVMLASAEDDEEFVTRTASHTVRRGETLSTIARKYRVSVAQLKKWNRMRRSTLRRGQRLVIHRAVRVKTPVVPAGSEVLAVRSAEKVPDTLGKVQLAGNGSAPAAASPAESRKNPSKAPDTLGRVQIIGAERVAAQEPAEEKAASERPRGRIVSHTIRRGETLAGIARKYDVEVSALKAMNNLHSNRVIAGARLKIVKEAPETGLASEGPSETRTRTVKPHYHVVQAGDTLWAISQRYGLTVDKIKKVNKIKGNELRAGMKILISG